MANNQTLYKNGCGDCKKAVEGSEAESANEVSASKQDPAEQYICPKLEQHGIEYERNYQ